MSDLIEFLLARLAEDEAKARRTGRRLRRDSNMPRITHDGMSARFIGDPERPTEWRYLSDEEYASLIEANTDPIDPDPRALADVDAKRRIVEWHENWPVLVEQQPEFDLSADDSISGTTLRMSQQIAWMTQRQYRAKFGTEPPTAPILRLLALPYADHPDFDQSWRPA